MSQIFTEPFTYGYAVYLLIFAFGLSVGSFLNVVIYRLPREGLSVNKPTRSFCPICQTPIHWYDNIPVFSWIFLRGRCRACKAPIHFRYPFVELLAGLLAIYIFSRCGLTLNFLFYFYFAVCLLAIALIDLELMIIPVILMYPTIILGLILAVASPNDALTGEQLWLTLEPQVGARLTSLAGAGLGVLAGWGSLWLISKTYQLVRGHEGMGDGDPPLLGMIGAFLGWQAVPMVILSSTVIGILSVGILMFINRKKPPKDGWGMKALPFGPFLVLGAFIYMFFGPKLIDWYFSLL